MIGRRHHRLQLTLRFLLTFLLTILIRHSIADLDNSLVEQPRISCEESRIRMFIRTRKPFGGNVYAKGFFHKETCRVQGNASGHMANITIPVSADCGMRRRRNMGPQGLSLDIDVILMFHRKFLTKNDWAFHVECQYVEMDQRDQQRVEHSLDIGSLPSTELSQTILHSKTMPKCRYEVLNRDGGSSLSFAVIGQSVIHKWSCAREHQGGQAGQSPVEEEDGLYCLTVHSCEVDDGQGSVQKLLDDRGCPLDKTLFGSVEYQSDLEAIQRGNAFKFADRPTVYFSCQLRLELRQGWRECRRNVDKCAESEGLAEEWRRQEGEPEDSSSNFPTPSPNGFSIHAETTQQNYGTMEEAIQFMKPAEEEEKEEEKEGEEEDQRKPKEGNGGTQHTLTIIRSRTKGSSTDHPPPSATSSSSSSSSSSHFVGQMAVDEEGKVSDHRLPPCPIGCQKYHSAPLIVPTDNTDQFPSDSSASSSSSPSSFSSFSPSSSSSSENSDPSSPSSSPSSSFQFAHRPPNRRVHLRQRSTTPLEMEEERKTDGSPMSGKFIDIDVNRAMDVLDVMANGGGGRKTNSDEKEEEKEKGKGEEDGVRQNELPKANTSHQQQLDTTLVDSMGPLQQLCLSRQMVPTVLFLALLCLLSTITLLICALFSCHSSDSLRFPVHSRHRFAVLPRRRVMNAFGP